MRKAPLETATLAVLQHRLVTVNDARLFAEEFGREMASIGEAATQHDQTSADRLSVVTREIEDLAANMLTGVLSPTLVRLLSDREAEKTLLEARLAAEATNASRAAILPPPSLLRLFEEKVGRLRETLDDETIRGEAAEILSMLIESVTIYPEGEHGPEAEMVAKVSELMACAINDNKAPSGEERGCCGTVGCGDRI